MYRYTYMYVYIGVYIATYHLFLHVKVSHVVVGTAYALISCMSKSVLCTGFSLCYVWVLVYAVCGFLPVLWG